MQFKIVKCLEPIHVYRYEVFLILEMAQSGLTAFVLCYFINEVRNIKDCCRSQGSMYRKTSYVNHTSLNT